MTPEYTEFEYIRPFGGPPTNVTFLIKVKPSGQNLVIKFADRYGVGAHQLLADTRMALRLLYCGLLDGRNDFRNAGSHAGGRTKGGGLYVGLTRTVVMEYTEGDTAAESAPWPNGAHEQVEVAARKLHAAQLVFGDCENRILYFQRAKRPLIDFDWAEKVGEARYPQNLSRSMRWPGDVDELEMEPILVNHDRSCLISSFPSNRN